jgi:uncharacterized protein YfaS (alpha-2-macroglobulin family)
VYLVEAVRKEMRAYTILMVSDLAMITKTGRGRIVNYVMDRTTGEPVAGADVAAFTRGGKSISAKTNADGLAEIAIADLGSDKKRPEDVRVLVRHEKGVAANVLAEYAFSVQEDRLMGYVYTDRPVYRPGHTVRFKAVLRLRTPDGFEVPAGKNVSVQIEGPDGQPAYQKQLTSSANGTVKDEFTLPAGAALGYYFVQVKYGDDFAGGNFEVEEYKKPEYEVRVGLSKSRVLQGESTTATVDSRYYFGEPVTNAAVKYSIYRDRYWFPLWYDYDDQLDAPSDDDSSGEEIAQGEGKLDADGKLAIPVPTQVSDHKYDYRYRIEARVTDPARREISGSGYLVGTYGSFLVQVTPDRYVYPPNGRASLTLKARDYDNNPIRTAVRVELLKFDWRAPDRNDIRGSVDGAVGADGSGRVELAIPPEGGQFRVRVSAKTPEGRVVESYSYLWVTGAARGEEYNDPSRSVQIIPDQKTYRVGDTAKIMIATGQPNVPVLVSVEGRDLKSHRVMRSADSSVQLEIPITDKDEPGVYVSAQFVRNNTLYQGSKYIRIPAEDHKLNVAVTTDKPQYKPGETATYQVQVTGVDGKPVPRAEFSLGVVDEAIYAIRADNTPDISRFFFGNEYNSVYTESSLSYYFSGEAGKRRMQLAALRAPTKLAQLKPERLALPKVRKAFPDTAFWVADVVTDGAGRAQAKVQFPDSLTTWRATTRAVTPDTKVGAAVVKNIVRKNLILRLAAPRFFVQGDEVVISAVVHNYLSADKNVQISLEAKGLDVLEGAGKTVAIPARGETRLDWRVRASAAGSARITGRALTDEESDALELEIPVNIPGVKLTEAKGGSLAAGESASFDLTFPARVQPGSRRLAIRVSPSIAGALFGAAEYLTSFPYGCVEQTMSSFLPNIIVRQAVRDLGVKTELDEAGLQQKIREGLDRLYSYQHEDGGWGWWETDDSHVFMTAYVTAGLKQAAASGINVRQDAISRGAAWVKQAFENDPRIAADLRAYMIYAMGPDADAAKIESVYAQRDRMSAYGQALLGLALEERKDARAAEIAALLEKGAQQDRDQAWWPSSRDEMLDFSTDATPEATAFAVRFLSHQRKGSPLLPKAALWLMNHRNEGYWWSSTKQTAMVIYGLIDYLKSTGELNGNLTATMLVNGRVALQQKMDQALSAGAPELVLDESKLQAGTNSIQVQMSGQGRLYYSVREEYFSADEKSQRTGNISLNLLRDYFKLVPVRTGERIQYDAVPLNGPVAPGDVLAVRLVVTGKDWKYLLVEDPIPSGTEFIERDDLYQMRNQPPWWRYWFTRREFHDDRMAIFQREFVQGQSDFFYLLKVVNPGDFQVSPARAQPMYQPDVLATSDSRRLEVRAVDAKAEAK